MKIKTPQQMAVDNLLVTHFAGSRAYGTSIPSSDTDIRGIFVAEPICVRTPFFRVEQVEVKEQQDTVFYELSKYIELTVGQNPNVIESLWTDEGDIIFRTEGYNMLRRAREQMLTSKIAMTTTGYAIAQLKRIKGHNKWLTQEQRGIEKIRTAYQAGTITKQWIEENFDEKILRLCID